MGMLDRFRKTEKVSMELRSGGPSKEVVRQGEEHEPKRVSPKDLETIYIREGMVHRWINLYSECILAGNYRIVAPNTRERRFWEQFMEFVEFRSLLRSTIRHQLIYGNAYWELVKNHAGTKTVSIALLDSKLLDVKRDETGDVQYDVMGRPIGYVQYVKSGYDTSRIPSDRLVNQTPKFDYLSGMGIFFKPKEIVHFKFNEVGESWQGVGLIEPIYNVILVKQNSEQGYAEAIQRTAYPRIWVQVGSDQQPATQEEIDTVWNSLQDLETKNQFVSEHRVKPSILEAKKTEKLSVNLNYFIDQIVAGLGGPKPFIMGTGEDTNRATLAQQKLFFERSLKEMQEELSAKIKREVFTLIAKEQHFKSVPDLVWDEISTESLDSKADRLLKYTKSNLLIPDKAVRNIIREVERLPKESDVEEPEPEVPEEEFE